VRNLGIARLIGAYQSQAVAAEKWGEPVRQKEDSEDKKHCRFADGSPGRQPLTPVIGQIRSRWFQSSFHFQQFSNGRAAACFAQNSVSWLCSGRLKEAGLAHTLSALTGDTTMVLKFQQGQG
jgi:hypothetical protein